VDSKEAQLVTGEVLAVLEETAMDKYIVIAVKKGASDDYSVCIKGFLGVLRKQRVYDIAEKHGLQATEDIEGLILYKSNAT
jgi:cell division protein FtsL